MVCKNKNNKENIISGLDNLDENAKVVFYPTVTKNRYLEYEANTGAVLSLTTSAPTLTSAVRKMYEAADMVHFESVYYRKDICKIRD